jgi:hypothetical protein
MKYIKLILTTLILLLAFDSYAQCNQHVFSSVGAEQWTNFQYQDCDGGAHYFGLPTGGYTIILCADIGTTFVLNGDGFVYPLLQEHPSYVSCIEEVICPYDFDGDGIVGVSDLQEFLANYGIYCGN